MPTPKQPSITDAKSIAKRYGKTGVVIFHYDEKTNDFGYSSYGEDKAWCDQMHQFGEQVFDAVMKGDIEIA